MRVIVFVTCAIAALFADLSLPRANERSIDVLPAAAIGETKSGSLLLKDAEHDRYVEAPRLGTDIDIMVSGPTARARVTQIFHNPTDGWVEAIYVYPLPEGGAVDTLKMVIGERIIVGDIKERQQARIIYQQAKATGRKASLIEHERPNMFTNSVANIGPGETVVVQIEYQEPVRQSGEDFSLRVPLVAAPRYNPKPIVQTARFNENGEGWGSVTDPVPDRDRIQPPVLDPRVNAPVNPVTISIRLQAGFPLGEVKSHHHAVKSETVADNARVITLGEGPVAADRDFELMWRPSAGKAPSVGLFRERVGDADYLLAFVTPPAAERAAEQRPREIIFVIDNSGSMGGTSMIQAKASLAFALGRLKPADRFNVIRFDHTMEGVFDDTVPADAAHVARAKAFVAALQASGGTEMVPPMRAALTDRRGVESGFLRQVVFLTDGAIGNEQQLFDTISEMRGRSRVFMVGIGSAPNSFLMTRAAELGRGTFTHIGTVEQVEERMRGLFEKLESPVVTNLTTTFPGTAADVTPAVLPDLYRGEPIVIAAKLVSLAGALELKGRIGERPWIVSLPLAGAADGKGLSKLWAGRKIADAEVARTLRGMTPEAADKRILTLALEHHLVTRLTSLVAVDQTPSRPEGARLVRAELPLNLPAGWEFDTVFGDRSPAAATRRADANALPNAQIAGATPVQTPSAAQAGGGGAQLPKTATDAELRLWSGMVLITIGLALLLVGRRRERRYSLGGVN
jgi:Ca-activated chloride channel family protein